MNTLDSLIVFVDVRGFTTWSEKVEVFPFLDTFISKFHQILHKNFKAFYYKSLGDGAMLIKEIKKKTNNTLLQDLIKNTLSNIEKTELSFQKMCQEMAISNGSEINLALGWGITKGFIKKFNNDYIGSEINKSSRLCSIARPCGIVIDKNDFPILPDNTFKFFEQKRFLLGISNYVNIWCTKEILTQFLTREQIKHSPEIHVAGGCVKQDKILIAKRNSNRRLFPNLYEGCGGQLAANENFVDGVKRHFKLEFGIDVDVIEKIHSFYSIQQPNEQIIPGISFLCIYKNGEPFSVNHSEIKWCNKQELESIPDNQFINGLKNEFLQFLKN